jgi:hypothetical protein
VRSFVSLELFSSSLKLKVEELRLLPPTFFKEKLLIPELAYLRFNVGYAIILNFFRLI